MSSFLAVKNWLFGCKCQELSTWIIANGYYKLFNSMRQIEAKKNDYTILRQCNKCGQYWQVDADYNTLGFAIKISDVKEWLLLSDFQSRREAMVEHHGGNAERRCKWHLCNNNALHDMVFCVDCTYSHLNIHV
jgi:hypothetical protein